MRCAGPPPPSRARYHPVCASSHRPDRSALYMSDLQGGSTSIRQPTASRRKSCSGKGSAVEKALRLAYSCHDRFPSPDTNTQQIFWTVIEVARLGARVDLFVPSVTPDV